MSYTLERFSTVLLPAAMPETEAGTGPSAVQFVELPGGGWYDALGEDQARRAATDISLKAKLLLAGQDYDDLRGLRGKRARLVRRRTDKTGSPVEWCVARLNAIQAMRKVENVRSLEVDFGWRMVSDIWYGQHHGDGWTLDSGEIFDDGLYLDEADAVFTLVDGVNTISLPNGGNAAVRNAILTFTNVGAAKMQSVKVEIVGASSILWDPGALVGGLVVEIDCGARSILYDGANAYSNFSVEAGHVIDDWLALEPGANAVKITTDIDFGTEVELVVDYSDGWE